MSEIVFNIAYYSILSLGLLSLLGVVFVLWYLVLNKVYQTLKLTGYVFEYLLYKKEFKRYLKSRRPKVIKPKRNDSQ